MSAALIRSAAVALCALATLVVAPATASAQEGGCSTYGESRTTAKGSFERLPDEVVELRSEADGSVIQIGIVRPKGPDAYRAPVIALASTYQHVDYAKQDLAECQPWFVENYVQHGYAVAFISVRGTGNSGGCHNLLGRLEQADMSQAITFLGTQGWSNGRVGLYGLSYDAGTTWSAAAAGNPYLKTIVPASGFLDLYDLSFGGGTYDWRWWLFVPGYYQLYATIESNPAAGHAPDRWFESVVKCPDLDAAYEATAESFATGERDRRGYWAERNHRPAIEERWRGSVLLIQGLQDWNVRPANNIPRVPDLGRNGVEVKQLLGQWGHAVPDWEHAHTRWDFADLALRWFDHHLKGDRSVDTGPAVEVQDSSGGWRAEDKWPPANTTSFGLGGAAPSEALLAPDSRSRHYFISEVPPGQTTDDWLPVPGTVEELCATCVAQSWDAPDGMRISGTPEVRVKATPTGSAGHVAAVLYRRDRTRGLKRLGWGMTDLRFPEGEGSYGDKPRAITAGQPVDLTIRLEPMEGVVEKGEQLVLVLGQGQSGQMPGQPPLPVRVALGAGRALLGLALVDPPADRFFTPPGRPGSGEGPGPAATPASADRPRPGPAGSPGPAACTASTGFQSVGAAPAGRRAVRLGFVRNATSPVRVDVFRVSQNRRIVKERLVARFENQSGPFSWDGRANLGGSKRDVGAGYYFVRYTMLRDGRPVDVRRIVLRRSARGFSRRPDHHRRDTCDLLRAFKLERPVFGGPKQAALKAAYRLTGAARVSVTVTRGRKVVKRYEAARRAGGRTYRVTLPARGRAAGDYRVRLRATGPDGRRVNAVLTARRL